LPTLLDLVGHDIPAVAAGHSYAPILLSCSDDPGLPEFTFSERIRKHEEHLRNANPREGIGFMARGRDWKYALYDDGTAFLFDLANDPGETENLADDPNHDAARARMHAALMGFLSKTGGNPIQFRGRTI
jgi:arylsulfatase A-like enzyme